MTEPEQNTNKPRQRSAFGHSLRIGRLFGIDICLDASVIIIFALVVWILGGSVFPGWHPDWGAGLSWLVHGRSLPVTAHLSV